MLPFVEEANGISAELDKRVKFEIVVIPPPSIENATQFNKVTIVSYLLAHSIASFSCLFLCYIGVHNDERPCQ